MNKKITIIGTTLAICLLVAGCGGTKLKDGKEIVSKVDGKEITAEDLYENLKSTYGYTATINMIDEYIANKEITDNKSATSYAESQLKQMKEYYEGQGYDFATMLQGNGFANEKAFKNYLISEFKKEQVAENYYKKQITDKEIEAYYKSEIDGELTVRHILIKPDVDSSASDDEKKEANEKAEKKAKELIEKLKKGEKFEDLAKENSDDEGTAKEGGLFSNFTKQEVDSDFWKGAVALKDNEYTKEPVKSQFGYHIILRVSQKEKPSLEDVKDTILDALVSEKMEEDNAIAKAWVEVRKEYKLEINDSEVKKGYDNSVKNLEKASS